MNSPEVTVFTAPHCASCAMVKRHLTERNVPYRERDVTRDPGALTDLAGLTSVRAVPVTVVGQTVITGPLERQRAALDAALHHPS